jgi:hypothetical protein
MSCFTSLILQVSASFLDMPEAKQSMRKKDFTLLGFNLTKIGSVGLGVEFLGCPLM